MRHLWARMQQVLASRAAQHVDTCEMLCWRQIQTHLAKHKSLCAWQRDRLPSLPDEMNRRSFLASLIASLLALAASAYLAWDLWLLPEPDPVTIFDATHTYLPLARALLQRGVEVLWSAESVRAAPMSYLWPALFNADLAAIRIANTVAGALICLLIYGTASRIHSRLAGVLAAWLLSLCVLLQPLLPVPLTEAPFLLFTALWWWGTTAFLQGRRWFALPAFVGGALSLLTRQVWLYPLALAAIVLAAWLLVRKDRRVAQFVVLQLAVLIVPAAVMIKNVAIANHPVVATGAGASLYFGQHPLTGGMDPPLVGLMYDEGQVMADLRVNHLTPLGDKVLSRIGREFLLTRSIVQTIGELPERAARVLFFANLGLDPSPYNRRAWRLGAVCLAAVALLVLRRTPMVVLLAAGLIMQTAQLSLVLFNNRYTIGTLEYPLILLAGIGLAVTFQPLAELIGRACRRDEVDVSPNWKSWMRAAAWPLGVLAACGASIATGYWVQRFTATEHAHVPSDRRLVRPLLALSPPAVEQGAVAGSSLSSMTVAPGAPAITHIAIPDPRPDRIANLLWNVRASVTPPTGHGCRRATVSFFNAATGIEGTEKSFLPRDDGRLHDYTFGAHSLSSSLFPSGPGELRFRFACANGTEIHLHQIVLYESRLPEVYGPRALAIARELR